MNAEEMGHRIAKLRKVRNLTQQQLADQLNVTNRAVSRWERGEGYPEITLLPRLADCLGVTTDEILGHAAARKPALRLSQQPQLMIWTGLILIFAVEIARRVWPQGAILLSLTGMTMLVILALMITMMKWPMSKLCGVLYSGLWVCFVIQLAAEQIYTSWRPYIGLLPMVGPYQKLSISFANSCQYPVFLQFQSLLVQAIWLPGLFAAFAAFLILNTKLNWFVKDSGWIKLIQSLAWFCLIGSILAGILFQLSSQWSFNELPPVSAARLSQLYPIVITLLILAAAAGLLFLWRSMKHGRAAGLSVFLLSGFFISLLPMQKLDYYWFKAEKLIPDITKLTEGWDRIHLLIQWTRPLQLVGIVCLGFCVLVIIRQEGIAANGKLTAKIRKCLKALPQRKKSSES